MLKKCAILGLAVLLVGAGALGWLLKQTRREETETARLKAKYSLNAEEYFNKYGRWYLLSPEEQNQLVIEMERDRKTKSGEQLAGEQQARLLMDLEKLAADEMSPGEIADFLYGPGWPQQVEEYKKQQEQKEIARTASIVCISIGGVILGGCILIWLVYGLMWLWHAVGARLSRDTDEDEQVQSLPAELTEIHAASPDADTDDRQTPDNAKSQVPTSIPIPLEPSGSGDRPKSGPEMLEEGFLPRTLGLHTSARRATLTLRKAPTDNALDTLMSDEAGQDKPWSADAQWSVRTMPEMDYGQIVDDPRYRHEPAVSTLDRGEHASEASNSLKAQAEDLQKQLAEVKQMAQTMQQATLEQPSPINNTLKELAKQVGAIRDYAASQQDRVEKLQDGYDWGIIRTFCLRVIRCVDNVEKRIAETGDGSETVVHLEEVRDELLFALESSGVEQYEPEIHSDYRGQEKIAEAVKEKQPCSKADEAGRIAKVLRPGYRYIIDDENFKVVRTAQVKLFG
jgi:molecular chaperone GrpE (heat shock protein)